MEPFLVLNRTISSKSVHSQKKSTKAVPGTVPKT